eukprot:724110-Prymnesium_polylepis.1
MTIEQSPTPDDGARFSCRRRNLTEVALQSREGHTRVDTSAECVVVCIRQCKSKVYGQDGSPPDANTRVGLRRRLERERIDSWMHIRLEEGRILSDPPDHQPLRCIEAHAGCDRHPAAHAHERIDK